MAKASVTIEENKRSPRPNYGKPAISLARSEKPGVDSEVSSIPRPEVQVSSVFDNVQIFEKSTIKLDREVYSKKGFKDTIDTEFGELKKKEDNFSPAQFFQLYDSLFFDIPKIGNNSHVDLIKRSRDYIQGFDTVDSRNVLIDNLNDRIIELEQELFLSTQVGGIDPEHPFFRNGTLVAEEVNGQRTGKFFYMDKGFKRKVDYTDSFYRTLLKVLGYETSDDYPGASTNILSQIKTGPNLGEGNFEQSTSIEEGELIIGNNITDDTKDAEINRLNQQINEIKAGNFSSTPELEAFVVDNNEAQIITSTITNSMGDKLTAIFERDFGSSYIAANGKLVRPSDIADIFNEILNEIADKSTAALQGYIYDS